MSGAQSSASPLSGVTVVDLTRHLPGPYTARMLNNLGARVIKVEEPELGDPVRLAPPIRDGVSTLGRLLLSGVESIALDLKRGEGQSVVSAMLEHADVLLESFRPGTVARFGLAPEQLRQRHPGLIVCSISGWGQRGPRAQRAGHDLTYQAAAGTLAATGAMPNLPAADLLGAAHAVGAINAALFARAKGGGGMWIDASLFDAAVVGNLVAVAESSGQGGEAQPGLLTGRLPGYRLYTTADDRLVAFAPLEEKFWKAFADAVDRPDIGRLWPPQAGEIHEQLEALFRSRAAAHWQALFRAHDLPGEVVATPVEAAGDQHSLDRGFGRMGDGLLPYPVLLSDTRPSGGERCPDLGEHTQAVLKEFAPNLAALSKREQRRRGIGTRRTARGVLQRLAAGRVG